MTTRAEFVQQMYKAGLDAGLTDSAARVMAAQAAHESAYGSRAPGYNYFGIKAGSSWSGKTQTLTTHEIINGQRVKVKATFRAYDTPEEAIADRTAFMARYFPAFNSAATMGDALDALQNGAKGKYYTDDQASYERSINTINVNYLDGTPVPPQNVGNDAVGSETDLGGSYKVRDGDTLGKIARQYGTTVDDIAKANNIADPNKIRAGQVLTVPRPAPTPDPRITDQNPYAPTLGWKDGEYDPAGTVLRSPLGPAEGEVARATVLLPGGIGTDERLMALTHPASLAAKGAGAAGGAGGAVAPVTDGSPRRAPFRVEGEPVSTAGIGQQPELQTLPPPPIAPAPEPGNGVWWVTQDEQPDMKGRGLPAGYSDDQLGLAPAAAAPTPMPGRPAAVDATTAKPTAKVSAPVDDSEYATLESGKRIKVGTYPSKNPGSSVSITRGPDGKAVITRHDPGIINPAKLGTNTLAGQFVRDQASKALADAKFDFAAPQPVSDAVSAIQDATSNSGEKITDAMVGATSAIGNFFGLGGGSKPPASVPATTGTRKLQDIHDARDDGAAKAPPARVVTPVMPSGGPGTFVVAPNYQFGLSDAPGSEQPRLPIVAANANAPVAPAQVSGSQPVKTVNVGADGSERPVQQTGSQAMGATAPSSISRAQPNAAQLGLGQEPPNLAIATAPKVASIGAAAAGGIPKYITTTQQVAIAPPPQAMSRLEDIHDKNDDRIVAAQQGSAQTKTVTTTTLNPEWVKAQQQAQAGAPAPRNRPAALTTPVAYKGSATGKVYEVGSQVKASGGRTMTVQSNGSFKDNKTGQVSAGSSGKRYALLEEAGAY